MKKLIIAAALSSLALLSCKKEPAPTPVHLPEPESHFSQTAPGGLNTNNVPLFVIIGADDCGDTVTMNWMIDLMASKKNPAGSGNTGTFDGAPAKMAFYVNGKYAENAGGSWKKAYEAGHEIGNHTVSHFVDSAYKNIDARLKDKAVWLDEILTNDSIILAETGMKKEDLVGFRVPRLEYNRDAYLAMVERGFLYDCSIEEGVQAGMDGTNNYWPYTMDNGSISDSLQALWSVGEADWGYKKVGKIQGGLWQLPVYNYKVPHDSLSEKYGFEKGLRSRIQANFSWFDTTTGNLTGFDYNVFAPADWSGAAMKNNEYMATLKYSFDLRLKGNRVPFTFGMHPDFYSESQNEYYKSAGDHMARRKVVEDFIDYALSHKDVRFVTGKQMIEWMKNPVGLNATVGSK